MKVKVEPVSSSAEEFQEDYWAWAEDVKQVDLQEQETEVTLIKSRYWRYNVTLIPSWSLRLF